MTTATQQITIRVLPAEQPPPPIARLLSKSDLIYEGAFRVPWTADARGTFSYGGQAPGFNPHNESLYLVGHDQHQQVAEITIPEIVNSANIQDLERATFLQPFQQVLQRLPVQLRDPNGVWIGGLMVVDGELIGTAYEYYDADHTGRVSHFDSSLALQKLGGLYQVGQMGGGFVGGYMCPIPDEWQDKLGAGYLTGQAALSIINRTSAGPAAFGFEPDELGRIDPVPVIPYVYYPISSPLEPYTSTNPRFNGTTFITGIVFPPGTRSILFFGSHGHGQYCYGTAQACSDPAGGGTGPHSVGGDYRYQVWAYDVLDFIDVKEGIRRPWDIQPYDIWNFELPFPDARKLCGGVAFDPATGRLWLAQRRADRTRFDRLPLIHQYRVRSNLVTMAGESIVDTGGNPIWVRGR